MTAGQQAGKTRERDGAIVVGKTRRGSAAAFTQSVIRNVMQAGPGTVGEAEAERLPAVAAEARAFLRDHGNEGGTDAR